MYAMRRSCPYSVTGRYELGYGYGTSSQVMLPGLTSVGLGVGAGCCADTTAPSASASARDFIRRAVYLKSSAGRPGPDVRQGALRVAAEDARDLRIGVAAPDQPLGEIEHAPDVIQSADRDAAVGILVILVAREVRLRPRIEAAAVHRVRVADHVEVAADRDVLDPDQLRDVVDMVEHVLDRDGLAVLHHEADHRDAHHAAGLRHPADRIVG